MDLLTCVETIGTFFSIVLCASPTPTYIAAWKTKDLRSISYPFLLATTLWSLIYGFYFIRIDNISVANMNLSCAVIWGAMMVFYHIINGDILRFVPMGMAGLWMSYALGMSILPIGLVGSIANVLHYGMIVATFPKLVPALKMKDPAYINLPIVWAGSVSGSCWMTYGLLTQDIFVFAPNFCSLTLGAI